jgi:uncharacterized protein DUF6894
VPHFFLDVIDGDRFLEDPSGIEFADPEAAVAGAMQGARELVAHGIMRNEDVSGQVFLIRDNQGARIATVPFRDTLPGQLRTVMLPSDIPMRVDAFDPKCSKDITSRPAWREHKAPGRG